MMYDSAYESGLGKTSNWNPQREHKWVEISYGLVSNSSSLHADFPWSLDTAVEMRPCAPFVQVEADVFTASRWKQHENAPRPSVRG